MTSQQKVILLGGAGVAFLIYRSKSGGVIDPKTGKLVPVNKPGLLSTLFPTRGTNSPYIASTNAATRNGTATAARVPSSGLGFPTTAARGVAGAPTTVGGVAQGAGAALQGLFNFLARKPATTAATTPAAQPKPSSGSGGGNSGGSSGGGSGGGSGRTAPMGGAAGVAGQTYSNGYFDENGNWVGYDGYYDENGQFVGADATTNQVGGAFDENGNWVEDTSSSTPVQTGAFDESGNWNPDADTSGMTGVQTGAFDENGDWQTDADPGVELLPSTDLGSGSGFDVNDYASGSGADYGPPTPDPISFDQPDLTGYADDQLAGDGTPDDGGGGGGGDDYAYSEDF